MGGVDFTQAGLLAETANPMFIPSTAYAELGIVI